MPTAETDFIAEALVLHKHNIKTAKYVFNDPWTSKAKCTLVVADCSGIKFKVIQGGKLVVSRQVASEENLILSTSYKLFCKLKIPQSIQIIPKRKHDLD
ncbi:MAG: hypothetical protein JW832_18165 [Deltaproteobacteria bacterium]|nr:hypothetical protein [Deltaproteobacteria bacterium]